MYRHPSQSAPYLVHAFNGHVVAVDVQTGAVVWRNEVDGSPLRLHVDDDVVIAVGIELVVIDYATGRVSFRVALEGPGISPRGDTLLVVGTVAYVSCAGVLVCISLTERRVLWRNALPGMGYGPAALGVPGRTAQADAG